MVFNDTEVYVMRYGYCRISKPKQSIERQIRNIKALYPDAVIVQEVFTRTRLDRKEWQSKGCIGRHPEKPDRKGTDPEEISRFQWDSH